MREELARIGMSKREFAEYMGVTEDAVYRWKDSPPRYAGLILRLLVENRGLRVALEVLK